MLEFNKYNNLKIENLKDLFTIIYVLVDDSYQQIIPDEIKFRRNYHKSKLSDSEIITISLVGEAYTSSENAWFNHVKRNYSDLFPTMGDRSRFNKTRRNLCSVIETVRNFLIGKFKFVNEDIAIIDSVPIPVCKFARAYFSKCFKDIAEYGFCASKKEKYYGFKLHGTVTQEGFITNFVITPANVDDRQAAYEVAEQGNHQILLADKGYIGKKFQDSLYKEEGVEIVALKRKNSKNPYAKACQIIFTSKRRRVETTFGQLTDIFRINEVLSKTKLGFKTRLISKVFCHNMLYILNFLMGKEPISQIKELVF